MPGLEMPYMPSYMGAYAVHNDKVELLNFIERAAATTINSPDHFECRRCDRVFGSRPTREQHWEASGEHFICLASGDDAKRYPFDGTTVEEILDHYLVVHNLHSYQGCMQAFVDLDVYMDHVDREFACPECHKHHDSENSVEQVCINHCRGFTHSEQHMITHRERNVGCWGCDRAFTSTSAMVLHLEAGCPSGVDRLFLNHHAVLFQPSWKFVDPAYHHEMICCADPAQLYPIENPAAFKCPDDSCGAHFITLSGLFQHVEFGKCPATLNEGLLSSLVEWLAHQVQQARSGLSLS